MGCFGCHRPRLFGGVRSIRCFRYEDVEAATSNFHPSTFLGRGSHGSVFRANLEKGRLVAAAKIIPSDSSNFHHHLSPSNEIEILSTIRSPRLVNLLGYTRIDHRHQHIAVVELMPNGSLSDHLYRNSPPPPWPRRVHLALHAAEAVRALHALDPPVIHRDIKPSNILIDRNGNARLGDFGLAVRRTADAATPPPAGTMGYMDPGYVAAEDVSTKSDVFSFGVLLLEMIAGRRAIDVDYSPAFVLDWALPRIEAGAFDEIWDERIEKPEEDHSCASVMRDVAVLAQRCVRSNPEKRPDMAEVVEKLKLADKRLSSSSSPMWWSSTLLKKMRRWSTLVSKKASYVATLRTPHLVVAIQVKPN